MSESSESIPRLIGDAIDQLSKLIHNEVQLARAEFSQNLGRAGKGAALVVAAGLMFIPTAVVLMIALALLLTQRGFSPVISHLLIGGMGLVATIILAMAGMSYLKSENLKLKVTTQQLERDVATAKGLAK
jgi:chromate transport protein ChrA